MFINIVYILHTYTHMCKYVSNISEYHWLTSIYPLQKWTIYLYPVFYIMPIFFFHAGTCCLDCNCLMSLMGLVKKPFGNQGNMTAMLVLATKEAGFQAGLVIHHLQKL